MGASNVNSLPRVPATPATLTPVRIEPPEYGGTKHCTDVPDVQPVVEHTSFTASEVVGESTTAPNSKPEIVALTPPVGAILSLASRLTTGPSKLKSNRPLPT